MPHWLVQKWLLFMEFEAKRGVPTPGEVELSEHQARIDEMLGRGG